MYPASIFEFPLIAGSSEPKPSKCPVSSSSTSAQFFNYFVRGGGKKFLRLLFSSHWRLLEENHQCLSSLSTCSFVQQIRCSALTAVFPGGQNLSGPWHASGWHWEEVRMVQVSAHSGLLFLVLLCGITPWWHGLLCTAGMGVLSPCAAGNFLAV